MNKEVLAALLSLSNPILATIQSISTYTVLDIKLTDPLIAYSKVCTLQCHGAYLVQRITISCSTASSINRLVEVLQLRLLIPSERQAHGHRNML